MNALKSKMLAQTSDPALDQARREEEKALITAIQAGDMSAFEDLVHRYEKKVYWIAFNLVGDEEDARDLAQESFLRVYKAIGRFRTEFNFYTWLYRIVVNLAIDHLRRRGKLTKSSLEDSVEEPPMELDPSRNLEEDDLKARIQNTLDSLPAKYKAVLVLRDLQDLSCEEISKIIHCTNATTRWRLHVAREMFKAKWEAKARAQAS